MAAHGIGGAHGEGPADLRELYSGPGHLWEYYIARCPGLGPAAARDIKSALQPALDKCEEQMDVRDTLLPTFKSCSAWGGGDRAERIMRTFESMFVVGAAPAAKSTHTAQDAVQPASKQAPVRAHHA